MNCSRAVLMTIGQLTFYDQIKEILLATPYFGDNVITHVSSSLSAVRNLYLLHHFFLMINSFL